MKLFALTFGDIHTPSSHFRIHQYEERFRAAGIKLEHALARGFRDFGYLKTCDVVMLQKTLLATSTIRKIRRASNVLIYDADDRIWMRPGKPYGWATRSRLNRRLKAIVSTADLCIAANRVIAADQEGAGSTNVEVLPMSVDTSQWKPGVASELRSDRVTIGWSGAPRNLVFLEPLLPALREILRQNKNVRLAIHSGERPSFDDIDFEHLPFEPGLEPKAVAQFDIGLLPLPDDPFVHGKSPIKALQYSACGVPIVGQAVGATAELLQHEVNGLTVTDERSWLQNLQRLVTDSDLRVQLGEGGKTMVERSHSMDAVFGRYLSLLQSALEPAQ
ncbi:MAG: glycosyltransferase involved in cell wall biosynthesis [Planctomycetota bacterium]